MGIARALVVLAAAVALVAGCGGDDETTGEASRTTGTTTAARGAGHDLFVEAGCGGCHGDDAQGTRIAPALAGHSEELIVRQVRAPLDTMPAYSRARLGDDDLRAIAAYVASLAPAERHVEPLELSNVVAMHHWMALSAIKASNRGDALHHVNHIAGRVEGRHLAAMREAREHLRAGDAHEAEHLIEEMLAEEAKPGLGLRQLHARLALAAVASRDRKDAVHHVRHLVELAGDERGGDARAVLAALERGDLHEAEHDLEQLLGRQPHEE